jgi:CRISPR type III-B/RAMP module RAMP protein Cmr6
MTAFAAKLTAAQNAKSWHLALDKFPFNLARKETPSLAKPDERNKEQSVKAVRLEEIRKLYTSAKHELQQAVEHRQRFLAQLARQKGPRFHRVPLVNFARLLLHLGRSSVLENVGIYCDRTTGLPVIPGTAVKGVVSTWACWEGNLSRDAFSTQRSALGANLVAVLGANPTQDVGASDSAGGVVFLGAFPQTLPGLELDIVTPHPQEGRGRITPSPFLAIKPNTHWDFALLAAPRVSLETAPDVLKTAACWLTECLTQIGLGAKTASGYGGFRELTDTEHQQDKQRFDSLLAGLAAKAAEAAMTPEARAYHDFVRCVSDWAAIARDIGNKSEAEKGHILRFFRSEQGQAIIKGWPKSDKAKARIAALKQAGL